MRRARLAIVAAAFLLLAGLVYLFSNAAALNSEALRSEIAARLSSWSGGRADITGPVRLSYFPELAVTTGHFRIASMPNIPYLKRLSAKGIRIELGFFTLLSPRPVFHRITFTDLLATLDGENAKSGASAGQDGALALDRALRSLPIPQLAIVNGAIRGNDSKTAEKITALNMDASVSLPGGALSASGSATWRKQPIEFALTGTVPEGQDEAAKAPMKLSLSNPLVSAEADGEVTLSEGLRATGTLDLRVHKLREFARWLGLLIPDGRGLATFRASGSFQLHGHRLGFDEGTFTLDGNRALGALAIDVSHPRPAIEGTLAFSLIDLRPYEKPPAKAGKGGTAKTGTAKQTETVDFPLLHHLDFDLRLSTSEIVTTPFTAGQVALSAVVNSGRLVADFAVLDICGGQGNGRLTFDAAVPQSEIRLSGSVAGLAAKTCTEMMIEKGPLAADLDLSFNLWSKGRTRKAVLNNLGGKVMASAGPGEMTIDLSALQSQSPPSVLRGWDRLAAGTSQFSKASAELIFRQGSVYTDDLQIHSRDQLYSGEGTIDLIKGALAMRIAIRDTPGEQAPGDKAPDIAPKAIARVTGPWSQPTISVTAPPPPQTPEATHAGPGDRPR